MTSSLVLQTFPNRTRYLLPSILFVGSILAGIPLHSQSKPPVSPPAINVAPGTRNFLVWGDVRFTDPARCDKSDPDVRQAIVQEMTTVDPHPDFAILTGD